MQKSVESARNADSIEHLNMCVCVCVCICKYRTDKHLIVLNLNSISINAITEKSDQQLIK